MNKVILIGRLGKDAEVNNVSGKNVINFNLAVSEKVKDGEKTTWFSCGYWTEKTGIAPYLKKGTQIAIDGSIDLRTYEKDGKQGASLQVNVRSVELLGGKSESQTSTPQGSYSQQPAEDTETLPF